MKKYLFIIPIVLLVGLYACEKISNDEQKNQTFKKKQANKTVPITIFARRK